MFALATQPEAHQNTSFRTAFLLLTALLAGSSMDCRGQQLHGRGLDPELAPARSLAAHQDWPSAQSAVREYLAAHPASGEAHALLGMVLFQLDQPEESIQEYTVASKQRALTATDRKTLGLAYATTGNIDQAGVCLTQSLALDPGDAGAWEALGHVRVQMGRYQDAIAAFQHVLRLAPDTPFAATEIGLANERLARFDAAAKSFSDAVRRQTGVSEPDPVPYIGLGRVLLKQNQPQAALAPLTSAAQLAPGDPEVHEQLGEVYLALNHLDQARDELERAVELKPDLARSHLELAQAYRKAGRKDDAAAQIELYSSLAAKKNAPPDAP